MKKRTLVLILISILTVLTNAQEIELQQQLKLKSPKCIDISQTGKYFVIGDKSGIKIYDSKTYRIIRHIQTDGLPVKEVLIHEKKELLFSIQRLATEIKVWDLLTGNLLRTLSSSHNNRVESIALSPDGNFLLSNAIDIWSLQDFERVNIIPGNGKINLSSPGELIYSNNGESFFVVGYRGVIHEYSAKTGQFIKKINSYQDHVNTFAVSSDSKVLVSGSGFQDRSSAIKLWNAKNGQLIKEFSGTKSQVYSVDISYDNEYILSAGGWYDSESKRYISELFLWDMEGNIIKKITDNYNNKAIGVKFIGNSYNFMVCLSNDVKIYEGKSFLSSHSFNELNYQSIKYFFYKNGLLDRNYSFTDLKSGICTNQNLNIKSYSSNAQYATVELNSGECYLRNLLTKKDSRISSGTNFFSKDNSLLIVKPDTQDSKSLLLYDAKTGTLIKEVFKYRDQFYVDDFEITTDNKFLVLSTTEKKSSPRNYSASVWDIDKDELLFSLNDDGGHKKIAVSKNGKCFALSSAHISDDLKVYTKIKIFNLKGNLIHEFNSENFSVNELKFNNDGSKIISAGSSGYIQIWDIETRSELSKFKCNHGINYVAISSDDKYLTTTSIEGYVKIWDLESQKELLTKYQLKDTKDFVVVRPDGRFDGTQNGISSILHYVKGMDIIPLDALYENFFTPNLWAITMQKVELKENNLDIKNLLLPPLVNIKLLEQDLNTQTATIQITATNNGGGIGEVKLFHNNKLVETQTRGFKKIEPTSESFEFTYQVNLVDGKNILKGVALSIENIESIPDEITLMVESKEKVKPNLNILVIGIDNYKNPKYKLNYALTDGAAFKKTLEEGSTKIFGSVNAKFIKESDVTKQNLLNEFEVLKTNSKQEDVFIFYYAGHGVMSNEENPQFYIIPYDVTQLYGNNEILTSKAVSANELQQFSKELKAQKQVFILDACQSGGMVELLASRGAAEEKAIAQLARSTGTFWLTASGSEQFATEFATLGHGVFTYAVLQALKGAADGGSKDKKITVKEISAFLNDKVPELSEKHKGQPQYPTSYGFGQDFPIVIIE